MKQKGISNRLFNKYSIRDRRKWPFVYCFVAFPVIQIAIFYFYVNLSSFALAFTNSDGSAGLGSFELVFKSFITGEDKLGFNPWEMVYKSITSWGLTQIATLFTILSCYVLTKHMIGSKLFRLIYYIPGIVGGVVLMSIMKETYSHNGIWTSLVKSLGVNLPERALKSGLLGAKETAFVTIMIQRFIYTLAGGGMIMAGAYMRIPNEIFEAAQIEGCGFFRETFQIALPLVWPTFSTLTLFSFCSILTADYGAYIWSNGTGRNGLVSVGFYLYRYQVTITQTPVNNEYLYGYVSAFGMLITAVTIPLVLLGRWILSKVHEDVSY